MIDRLAEHLLGRHVAAGPADLPGLRALDRRVFRPDRHVGFAQLGDAEIEQLHAPIGSDERIRRFDVAVPDALRVRGVEGAI